MSMNPLAYPVVRVILGTAASAYLSSKITPKILNSGITPEITDEDAAHNATRTEINKAAAVGVTIGLSVITFVGVGMLIGETPKVALAAAAKGAA